MMYLCHNPSTDPAFNLALEEYALTRMDRDLILLWRNAPAVIVGNNQNTLEEIDESYCREQGIAVVRRLSGGGAVFHDLGNLNFTVIHPLGAEDFSNYEKFTAPICAFLQTMGVDARLQGRNDLVIGGAKFSGNAQAVRSGRILHHGTILYSADFGRLAGALRPNPAKIKSKGIKSVRSRVTNVADHMARPMDAEQFLLSLYDYLLHSGGDMREYELTGEDRSAVENLAQSKYRSWQWNFGKSPAYDYVQSLRYPFGGVELRLQVEKGVIAGARLYGDFFGMRDKAELERSLEGVRHSREAVQKALRGICVGDYIQGMDRETFLLLF